MPEFYLELLKQADNLPVLDSFYEKGSYFL